MKFLKFLTKIKGFWKIYSGYGYDGETIEFIINNYTEVLENRTKLMSKPTYYARDVIEQIDDWYERKNEMLTAHKETKENVKIIGYSIVNVITNKRLFYFEKKSDAEEILERYNRYSDAGLLRIVETIGEQNE